MFYYLKQMSIDNTLSVSDWTTYFDRQDRPWEVQDPILFSVKPAVGCCVYSLE